MKVRCKACGDIIESLYRHDFKYCYCETIAVDGGNDYLKLTGEPRYIEVLNTSWGEFLGAPNIEVEDEDNKDG